MTDFLIPLFPENSLAASVTTTVWVGVWVVVFFNLRLGWTLSGLVVPGYLVPLLLIKPMAAGVIFGEAILTYTIVATLSEYRHFKPWTSFFGRDRFFALILVSILVRGLMDGYVLPVIGDALTFHYGWRLSFRDDLHSFGLIIVSLVANYFWKPGLFRGLGPLATTIMATYLVVRFVLVPYTNFSLGNLQFMYEEIATSLLASPKAYIILVTTAYIASRMNLYYGWDFNGILIPALIAIEWPEPFKILVTFIESFVVMGVASALLKLPIFQRITMEGARKTLLFFNVTFCMRLLLGHLLPLWFTDLKVSDLFGFGYLLSTLIAMRMHGQGLYLRIPRVSLQISLVGAIAGSLIGFLMTRWIILPEDESTPVVKASVVQQSPESNQLTLVEAVRMEQPRLFRHHVNCTRYLPSHSRLASFTQGIQLLSNLKSFRSGSSVDVTNPADDLIESQDSSWRTAAQLLATANYDLRLIEGHYALLKEREPGHQQGTYVLDLRQEHGLVVEVPAPREEWGTLESGLCLFSKLQGRAFAFAGADPVYRSGLPIAAVSESGTFFEAFHRTIAEGNVLSVRGPDDSSENRLNGSGVPPRPADHSRLWIKRGLPEHLDLPSINLLLPELALEWSTRPGTDILRDAIWTGHGELTLCRQDRELLASLLNEDGAVGTPSNSMSLSKQLRQQTNFILPRASNQFRIAREEDLFFFDAEVLQPVLKIVLSGRTSTLWNTSEVRRWSAAAAAARVMNYQLTLCSDDSKNSEFAVLSEGSSLPGQLDRVHARRGWGTYAFRLGNADASAIEVPRPLLEKWTIEFGISIFHSQRARLLMVAGAHPHANTNRSADVIAETNQLTLYNLVRQSIIRQVDPAPWRQIQLRAFDAPLDVDVLLAPAVATSEGVSRFNDVVTLLTEGGLRTRLVDGESETAGYESTNPLLVKSLRLARDAHGMLLWLAPHVRMRFRSQVDDRLQAAEFAAISIPTLEGSVKDHLKQIIRETDYSSFDQPIDSIASRYLMTRNIVDLRQLQALWKHAEWIRVLDTETEIAYLIGRDKSQLLCLSLAEPSETGPRPDTFDRWTDETIEHFLSSHAAWNRPAISEAEVTP